MVQETRTVVTGSEPVLLPPGAKVAATRPAAAPRASLSDAKLNLAGEDRRRLIAEAAYFRAERRGFQPGQELEDWLAAEIEIDALLGDDDGRA
jgi:hypothetical protein